MKLIFFVLLLSPFMAKAQPTALNIIPAPVQMQLREGDFVLDNSVSIHFQASSPGLQQAVVFWTNAVQKLSGFVLAVNSASKKKIEFITGHFNETGNEGYLLEVKPDNITIKANTKAGIIYGIQTLIQTLPAIRTNGELRIPCMEVKDYPRFQYRGMHLDVSRHFFGPEIVKEYIDLIASYKMNVFHWHLVDDQGWRIEIKKYPKLTSTGAWRVDYTNKVWGDRPQAKEGELPAYGGYYTQEQLKDIVAYAQARNITIIPEIEMPGHVASAIASYPQLSCKQQPQLPLTGGNYINMSSNYCAGNDSVFTFLENVLTEVMAIFPSAYVHVGGDEVDKTPWKKCIRCQARIRAEGLKDENELQSYFIKRIEKFIVGKKRKMIGWDEILEGGLAPEATVMSWRGETGGIEAAKMKHEVIMTPGSPCYFDHYQAGPEGEPIAIGGMNTLKKVYDYEPIPKELSMSESKYVLGAQGNVWTEFITTAEHLEYMVLPRMPALAEVLWTPKENKSWTGFNERIQYHFRKYEQNGLRYCAGNFTVTIKPVTLNNKLTAVLSSEISGSDIYYTIDGTEPTIHSYKYKDPVDVISTLTLKASTAVNGRIMSVQAAKQDFVLHKAVGGTVTYFNPVSKYYMADGPNTLADGVRGTQAIGQHWHGFSGKDMIATIDLGETKTIRNASLSCLQKYRDWIFLPQSVKFELSADGTSFTEAGTIMNPYDLNKKELRHVFVASFTSQPARYIRVTAKNNVCPPGHSGAGKPAWIFADEIIVD